MVTTNPTPVETQHGLRARAAASVRAEQRRRDHDVLLMACEEAAYLIETLADVLREDFQTEAGAIRIVEQDGRSDGVSTEIEGLAFFLSGDWTEGTWSLSVRDTDDTESSFALLYRRDSRFERQDPWLALGAAIERSRNGAWR